MGRVHIVNGVVGSVSYLCRYYNKPVWLVRYKLKQGLSLEEALFISNSSFKERKKYVVGGREGYISELSKEFGINQGTVYSRLKRGMSIEEALLTKPKIVVNNNLTYTVNGVTGSLKELSDYFCINYSTVRSRLKYGVSLEDALLTPIKKIKTNKTKTIYTVEGVTGTLQELACHYNISFQTVVSRLRRGWSLEEALLKPVTRDNVYTINGFTGSKRELCNHFGMNYKTVEYRLSKGISLEEALNPSPLSRGRIYKVRGVTGNISKLSDYFGISKETVKCRLRKGMSIEEAFTKPVKCNKGA